jgi:ribose transport system permease protein
MAEQKRINFGLDRFSGLYLWALFIIIFAVWVPHLFLSIAAVHTIADNQAVPAILAIAALVPLTAGAFDLSVGANMNLATIVVVILQVDGWNMWAAIVVAVAVSALIGVVNGFIVVKLGVSSFIATLGMATIIAAVQTIVSGDIQPLSPTGSAWVALANRQIFGFQIVFVYLIVLAFLFWWILEFTPFGRYLYAIGGNPEAARLSGVNVGKWTWCSLIISGTLSGCAGVLYGALSGPSLTYGSALLLPAFAAIFLGTTQIKPGRANLWGTMLAVFVLATGVVGLQYVTGAQWLNDMFSGVALLVAVSFAVWRQRRTVLERRTSVFKSAQESQSPAELDTDVSEDVLEHEDSRQGGY